jgi:hypothetical protein
LDSDLCEGFFYFFKLEWFNDSFDFFHICSGLVGKRKQVACQLSE